MNDMQADDLIVGIDLGTTNSVVAAIVDGTVRVLEENGEGLLPSVIGLGPDGKLLTGRVARNQLAAFPERTISSVKRRMGEAVKLRLGDQECSPEEVSAMILRRLRARAESVLGRPVRRAVITVPAWFDEPQRQATRAAGELAGLTVERIINEPTAASLVYEAASPQRKHLIVYDLGGGTFDVSIVRVEAGVVEVLASRGDVRLGGDDFDQVLAEAVAREFQDRHDIDLQADSRTRWRLLRACEDARCRLSAESVVRIADEFIAESAGQPLSLDVEFTREEFESLVQPLVARTIDCVHQALADAGMTVAGIDDVVLVGGVTRTPLVQRTLRAALRREPRWAVNPDLAVALGAATQAAMQMGLPVGPVLVDVATHTLGIETLESQYSGRLGFTPILRRNAPLPARHEMTFYTVSKGQKAADIRVFQGETGQLEKDRLIGSFRLEGLNQSDRASGEILVCFQLSLDGTLEVTARERSTAIRHSLRIGNALARLEEVERRQAGARIESWFDGTDDLDGGEFDEPVSRSEWTADDDAASMLAEHGIDDQTGATDFHPVTAPRQGPATAPPRPHFQLDTLIQKAADAQSRANPDDAADIGRLIGQLLAAREEQDGEMLTALVTQLEDLLFYVNG